MMYSCTREQYFPADLLWISVSFKIWKELGKNGFHLYFRATFSHLHKMNFYEKHILKFANLLMNEWIEAQV